MTCSNITNVTASISEDSFWNSVNILIQKPHVVNKRLWGSKTLFKANFKFTVPVNLPLHFERIKNIDNIQEYTGFLYERLNLKASSDNASSNVFILLELLPKTYNENHAFQVVILNKGNGTASFYDVTPNHIEQTLCPTFCYSFELDKTGVQFKAESG